jgi:tripeptide aminopeptidase
MRLAGMEPVEVPIRGGTDGARLSYEGLPCPNLCTGGENYHGRFEYITVEDIEKCVQMLVYILTTL